MLKDEFDELDVPFYARVYKAVVECPYCRRVNVIGRLPRHSATSSPFDHQTDELTCSHCQRKFLVGIILWSHQKVTPTLPADHVPTADVAAQLRALSPFGGHHLPKATVPSRRAPKTNTHIYDYCTCRRSAIPHMRKRNPDCPVHGPMKRTKEEDGGQTR